MDYPQAYYDYHRSRDGEGSHTMAKAKKVVPKKKVLKKVLKKKVTKTSTAFKKVANKSKSKSGIRSGILSRIKPISELAQKDKFCIGIFGEPATGKTTFWTSFPKPILAAICSGGRKVHGEFKSIPKEKMEGIESITLQSCDELGKLIQAINDQEEGYYKTFVLDHLTSFADLAIMEVLGLDQAPAQMTWGTAAQEEWGQVALIMKGFLRDIMNLDCYSAVIAHERIFEPPEDSEIGFHVAGPAVTPSVARWLHGALDFQIQMFRRDKYITKTKTIKGKETKSKVKTDKQEFCAYINMHNERSTKFRSPLGENLPNVVVDPTFEKLTKLMEG